MAKSSSHPPHLHLTTASHDEARALVQQKIDVVGPLRQLYQDNPKKNHDDFDNWDDGVVRMLSIIAPPGTLDADFISCRVLPDLSLKKLSTLNKSQFVFAENRFQQNTINEEHGILRTIDKKINYLISLYNDLPNIPLATKQSMREKVTRPLVEINQVIADRGGSAIFGDNNTASSQSIAQNVINELDAQLSEIGIPDEKRRELAQILSTSSVLTPDVKKEVQNWLTKISDWAKDIGREVVVKIAASLINTYLGIPL